uniref:Uncharacterized protein n=1 Tax=Cannabis sativa TaxID=3483 RepID=A0A803P3N2_CANSA
MSFPFLYREEEEGVANGGERHRTTSGDMDINATDMVRSDGENGGFAGKESGENQGLVVGENQGIDTNDNYGKNHNEQMQLAGQNDDSLLIIDNKRRRMGKETLHGTIASADSDVGLIDNSNVMSKNGVQVGLGVQAHQSL